MAQFPQIVSRLPDPHGLPRVPALPHGDISRTSLALSRTMEGDSIAL
jgi:hypothetical protein